MTRASEAKRIYITQELTESESMIEELSTSRLCHIHRKEYSLADVLVRGYGGYNTRWALFLLHHLFPLESSKPPLATTIFFGANDAALSGRTSERQHVPIPEYKLNLQKIVLHLKVLMFCI
ncbi:SGNH hydrolase-type esterase superfamily protein [Trifolium repens]|nr:SGNH hydrolase-type esterase superfamily protein [Trifolium repens]